MKLKHTVFAALIGCFAFGFIGCSKVSNGIPPAPTVSKFLKGANGPPVWIVNNVEIGPIEDNRGKRIFSPDNIEHITVLSPASTTDIVSRYGANAKNGVVLVATRNAGK